MNIDFIFCVMNKINASNEGISLEVIIDFIKPYLLYLLNNSYNLNENYYSKIDNLLSSFNEYIDYKFLFIENKKYYINISSPQYIKYLSESTKFDKNLQIFSDLLNKLNNLSLLSDNIYPNEIPTQENKNYIMNSFSNAKEFYIINKALTICNCKAFVYCKKNSKTCKHIDYIKTLSPEQLNKIYIYDLKDKTCTCSKFKTNKYCGHSNYLKNLTQI